MFTLEYAMSLRNLLIVNAFLATFHGLGFLLLPTTLLGLYQIEAGTGAQLMGQLFGAELIVVAHQGRVERRHGAGWLAGGGDLWIAGHWLPDRSAETTGGGGLTIEPTPTALPDTVARSMAAWELPGNGAKKPGTTRPHGQLVAEDGNFVCADVSAGVKLPHPRRL